ncbi:MAG: DUF397 domain-containing protein, partial [Pseudonocardia sp.]
MTPTPPPAAPRWVKARRSDNANACVEVMRDLRGHYHVRDSKAGPHGPVIDLAAEEWAQLCTAATQRTTAHLPTVRVRVEPGGTFRIEQGATVLRFT